jgi:hypothetical protein
MSQCPDPERLFLELTEGGGEAVDHAASCQKCFALVEDHRSLEKELFRLSDPFPPSDFVANVMAKVSAQPAPVRSDTRAGVIILVTSLVACALAFIVGPGSVGQLGTALATTAVTTKSLVVAFSSGLSALWAAAAVPLTAAMAIVLFGSLLGLRRLVAEGPSLDEAKVSS